MLLYHMSEVAYLNDILADGKLRPASKTKNKSQNPYDLHLSYVFFNAIPRTKLSEFVGIGDNTVGFVFDQSTLLNRQFYTNHNHSAGNTESSKKYKIDNSKELTKVLYALYKRSHKIVKEIKMKFWILSAFQEVFTRVEPSLNEAKYIVLPKKNKKLIATINRTYPRITVLNPK